MRPRPLDSELARFVSAGALGGGINAWLCYAGIPVVVSDTYVEVAWHLVPAGTAHGAVLALAALLATRWARRRGWPARVGAAVAAGWIAGYVSWEVLLLSLNENFTGIAWPFDDDVSGILLGPFNSFGLVVTTYCLVALLHSGREGSTGPALLTGMLAGVLGSLWFWIDLELWYYSLIHGTIWGVAVGAARHRRVRVDRGAHPIARAA